MRTIAKILPIVLTVVATTAAQAQTYYHYECTDGASFELAFYPETKAAFLQLDGKSLQLPKRFSLTGQRFARNGVTFSMKNSGVATVRRAGKTSQCKVN
jgi:membrane-bound inhibitor of C-type lysozyme